jgi:hypothetical protein
MNPVEALRSADLLGCLPAFRNLVTWRPWLVFLKVLYGLPLDDGEFAFYRQCTQRSEYRPPAGGYREAFVIVGRQSGKSRICGTLAAVTAVATPESGVSALLVAQDQRAALRVLGGYAREPFRLVPSFCAEVHSETAERVELRSGASLDILPCRPAAVRGLRASIVCVDEASHYSASDGRDVAREMLIACRATVLTTGGRVVVLTSPYAASGPVYDAHKAHFARSNSDVLVWQASSRTMNPTLGQADLDRMRAQDPAAAIAEIDGRFLGGISNAFADDVLDACTRPGGDLLPAPGKRYRGGTDRSAGRNDAAVDVVAHPEPDGRIVVDAIRTWPSPHNPQEITKLSAEFFKSWGVREISGDRYAGEWPAVEFAKHDICYKVAEHSTSDLLLRLIPLANSKRLELPRDAQLLKEFRQLERRRGSGGKDHVEARRGCHDDIPAGVAQAVCAALPGLGLTPQQTAGIARGLEWSARQGRPAITIQGHADEQPADFRDFFSHRQPSGHYLHDDAGVAVTEREIYGCGAGHGDGCDCE